MPKSAKAGERALRAWEATSAQNFLVTASSVYDRCERAASSVTMSIFSPYPLAGCSGSKQLRPFVVASGASAGAVSRWQLSSSVRRYQCGPPILRPTLVRRQLSLLTARERTIRHPCRFGTQCGYHLYRESHCRQGDFYDLANGESIRRYHVWRPRRVHGVVRGA